jgi:predicted dehydrogenase
MAEQGPVRYAVVGLGRAGWNIHVYQLRPKADARIVAVADPMAERRDEAVKEFGCKAYESIDVMLADKSLDAEVVVVATPSNLHGPDTKKALKAGKHVVVEKPMAMSVAEADSMIKAAKAAKRKLFVHQNYRFHREFTYYKHVIDSGLLGKVFHLRNSLVSNFGRRNDWQTLAKNGGGVLNNTCPHFIDQGLQLMGTPVVQVIGDLKQIVGAGDVEDHVNVFIKGKNGCTFHLEVSSVQAMPAPLPKWTICGTQGTLVSDGKNATIKWFDPAQVQPIKAVDAAATDRKYGNDDKLPWQTKTEPCEGPNIGDFYDNVYAVLRNKAKQVISPESVREVIRVIAASRKGTRFTGKPAKEGSLVWKGK